jgi:hypothetical protein
MEGMKSARHQRMRFLHGLHMPGVFVSERIPRGFQKKWVFFMCFMSKALVDKRHSLSERVPAHFPTGLLASPAKASAIFRPSAKVSA